MRIRSAVAGALLATCFLALTAASEPIRLEPSGPWIVDYAENSCRLIRHFGAGANEVVFALESEAPGSLDMLVSGKPLETSETEGRAKFLPLQNKPMIGLVRESVDKMTPVLLFSSVRLLPDDAAAAEEKEDDRASYGSERPVAKSFAERAAKKALRQTFADQSNAIEIYAQKGHPIILKTGSLGEPIKAFDKCTRDSLRDWGVDPDVQDKVVRDVWARHPAAWFSVSDYPYRMVSRGEESEVKVRILVDATGRPTKCTAISHFREPEFNQITCDKFMARAHFEPAELADGTKVASYYVVHVVFRLAG